MLNKCIQGLQRPNTLSHSNKAYGAFQSVLRCHARNDNLPDKANAEVVHYRNATRSEVPAWSALWHATGIKIPIADHAR